MHDVVHSIAGHRDQVTVLLASYIPSKFECQGNESCDTEAVQGISLCSPVVELRASKTGLRSKKEKSESARIAS